MGPAEARAQAVQRVRAGDLTQHLGCPGPEVWQSDLSLLTSQTLAQLSLQWHQEGQGCGQAIPR